MLSAHVAEALAGSGHRIVVTGASGWIGRATLELLRQALGDAFGARVRCFGSARRELGSGLEQRPLAEIASLPPEPTLVLHLAFLTKDRAEAMDEAEYRRANDAIRETVIGALGAIGTKALFLASSGAAARVDDPAASAAMRLYGSMKRDDEDAFAAWAEAHGKRAVIARIFNISGPHINKQRSYALASFILDALGGGPVKVQAAHPVVRGYVAVRELMSLVFAMLLERGAGVARFDSGGAPMEMQAIAQTVAELLGGLDVERARFEAGPAADEYVGDHPAYCSLLARYGLEHVPFPQQVTETAAFLGQSGGCAGWSRQPGHGSGRPDTIRSRGVVADNIESSGRTGAGALRVRGNG